MFTFAAKVALEQLVVDWVHRNKCNGDDDLIPARRDDIDGNRVVGAYTKKRR